MRTIMLRASLAFALMTFAATAAAQSAPQVVTLPISRPGEPIFLEIDLMSADIEVIGEDRDDAMFEISVADSERKIVTPSGTKTLTGAGYSLEVYEEDNEISLDADWRSNKVTVLARIPRNADLELSTVNDGTIIVRNIIGNLELSNVNGPVTASGISGSVIAESINDTIDVSFVEIDDVNASSLESMNGNLRLGLPANAGAQVHLDTAQGEIVSDFEVEVLPSKPTIERDDERGSVEVRIESVIVANINGGGPVVRLKSMQGDIHIAKSP